MNSIKTFGLTALAVLVVTAFTGPSAMAESTQLCTGDPAGAGCGSAVTHVHASTLSGAKAKLLTNILTVECDVLFLGNTVASLGSPLIIEGEASYTNCGGSCSVTEVGGPFITEVLKTGHETAEAAGEGETHVNCLGLNCFYDAEGLVGTIKGPLLSTETNGEIVYSEQTAHKVKGLFCPSTGKADNVATLLSAAYISS